MIEKFCAQARQAEKIQNRTLDIKKYVELLTEHINDMKIVRVSINQKVNKNIYRDDFEHINAYTPGTGGCDSMLGEIQIAVQREKSSAPNRFSNARSLPKVTCFHCSESHRLFSCNAAKNDDYRNF